MNNIIDETVMTGDACLSGGGLQVASGQLSIAPNAINSSRLATDSVTTNAIADLNITTGKIADSNVTTAKIANSNVTSAKLEPNITVTSLTAGTVTSTGGISASGAISATGNITANGASIGSGGILTTGDIAVGAVTNRSAVNLLIGWERTVAGTSNLYFYSDAGGTVDAGIERASGTNGNFSIFNQGSGYIYLTGATRYGYNTASPTNTHHFSGGIRYTSPNAAGTGTYLIIDANGDIKALGSSLRYKNSIEDYNKGLEELKQLRPVTYKFNGEDVVTAGFIAEEVDAIGMGEYVVKNSEGQPDALNYGQMVALLVNAIKEQQQQIDELKAKVQ
jgi:hypothetical protein